MILDRTHRNMHLVVSNHTNTKIIKRQKLQITNETGSLVTLK